LSFQIATALWTYFGIWLARVKKIYATDNKRNENSGTNVQVTIPERNLNEPEGLRFLQEAAFSDTTFS